LKPFQVFAIPKLVKKSTNHYTFKDKESLMQALMQKTSYLSSFQNNNAIPNHGFDALIMKLSFWQ
jgi:hypothetical protein